MRTENLDLRIITAEETPSWLTDFNTNMDKIDEFAGQVHDNDVAVETDLQNLHSADSLINTRLDGVTNRVGALETTTTTNTNDISNLKTSVDTIQNDLITQNTAVKQLQTDTSVLKTDVATLKTDVDDNMGDIATLQADITTVSSKADSAKATADSAVSTAGNAFDKAVNAKSTAENAESTANSARSVAEGASVGLQNLSDTMRTLSNKMLTLESSVSLADNKADMSLSTLADTVTSSIGRGVANQGFTRVVEWRGTIGIIIVNFAQINGTTSEIESLYKPDIFYVDGDGRVNGMPKDTFYEWTPSVGRFDPTPTVSIPNLKIRSYTVGSTTKIELQVVEQAYPFNFALGLHLIEDIPLG